MSFSKFIFAFCECFFEKRIISVVRWLKKLEHELSVFKQDEIISSGRYMNNINLLLIDDAVEWAKINVEAANLLTQEDSIVESVVTFRNLFQKQFSTKTIKTFSTSFDIELEEMKQKSKKLIEAYHKRFLTLMLRYGVKNRSIASNLFLLKSVILDVIMKTFVRGLLDDEVRKKTIRGLFTTKKSLRGFCSLTKNADRSKREFQKLMKEENKSRELKFYRNMIQRTMPQDRIEAMLVSYRARPVPIDWMQNNPFQVKYKRSQSVSQSEIKSAPLNSSIEIENLLSFAQFRSSSQSRWNAFWNLFHKSTSKDLLAASTSKNSYINET